MSTIKLQMVVGFVCEQKDDAGEKTQEIVTFNAAPPSMYDPAVVVPNNTYALGSPAGEMLLNVTNPEAWGFFKAGDKFSFEFTKE